MYILKAVSQVKKDLAKLHPKVTKLIQEHHIQILKERPSPG
jgi:hypothetical protein